MGPGLYSFPLFAFGWTGVDLFFVLSGYLIGRQLWSELKISGTIDFYGFFIRRGLRIWPLYFAILLTTFLTSHRPAVAFWPDVTFLSNYFHHQVGGGWTLSTEEQFYLISPLALIFTSRLLNRGSQAWPICLAIGLLPLVRAITIYNARDAFSDMTTGGPNLIMPFHTHSDGLFVGFFLAWITVFHENRRQSLRRGTKLIIFLTAATISFSLRSLSSPIFGFTALALIYGTLVFCTLSPSKRVPPTRVSRVAYVISRLSYGVYLNHFLILPTLLALSQGGMVRFPANVFGFACFAALAFLACLLTAAGTFFSIELPFLNIRDRWLVQRTKAAN